MKDLLKILFLIFAIVFSLWVSNLIFDAVIHSNLSPFWKYVILR